MDISDFLKSLRAILKSLLDSGVDKTVIRLDITQTLILSRQSMYPIFAHTLQLIHMSTLVMTKT